MKMAKIYKCVADLYLDKYDEDGFHIENQYVHIPKDSIWEEDAEHYNFIAPKDSVHLDRVWKLNKAKTHQWIEIDKGTLLAYFKPQQGSYSEIPNNSWKNNMLSRFERVE